MKTFLKLMLSVTLVTKRKDEPWIIFLKEYSRKRIETSFSEIKNLFLRKIHSVTFKGFLLKLLMFIVAFTFNRKNSSQLAAGWLFVFCMIFVL